STYRLQLVGGFGFAEARALLPYFVELGVDALYLSPILTAEPGSAHGYDVVDPTSGSAEPGGEAGRIALANNARSSGIRLVVDFVPNHMGIASAHNALWWDLLENGPSAYSAEVFDVDWHPAKPSLQGRVLLPILGDNYGSVLERGELRLV